MPRAPALPCVRSVLLAALGLWAAACGAARTAPARPALPTLTPVSSPVPGTLYVDAGQALGPISPYVYGTNYGPWVALPHGLMPAAVEARLTYLRFPAGAYGDSNNLQPYQIDQFIALARQLGAEPSISVRLKEGTPEAAAALVEYANVSHGYDVRYWSIGNEPSLYATADRLQYDTERYNEEWRAYAQAMRAVDPEIVLVGPDIHQYTGDPAVDPKDAAGRDWMREFLRANGDMVDVVAIHRYPFPTGRSGSRPPAVDDLRANAREWDRIIPNLRALIRETTGRDLPVAVTEVNSNWTKAIGGEATPDSFYNAIWWADVLGRLIRQGVDIVAHFVLTSKDGQGGWGLVAGYDVRPSYYVYRLYQQFGSDLVYASSDDTDVSIYAARRADGRLTLMVVNLGPEARTGALRIEGFNPAGPAEVWRLDAEHQAEKVGPEAIGWESSIRVPGQSVSLYVVPGR